ncbi:MAG: SRPBCC domain-containing protein [Acidimicrobiia bacterium]
MPTGLTADVGWQIGVSRTLDVPISEAWNTVCSPAGVAIWLGRGAVLPSRPGEPVTTADGGLGELRSLRPFDRVRLRWHEAGWDHPTTIQVAVSGSTAKTVLRFHQEHLVDEVERERQRDHWRGVLDRMEPLLTERG